MRTAIVEGITMAIMIGSSSMMIIAGASASTGTAASTTTGASKKGCRDLRGVRGCTSDRARGQVTGCDSGGAGGRKAEKASLAYRIWVHFRSDTKDEVSYKRLNVNS
jgi:hypothetical protein